MKAALVFTGSSPILILTSYAGLDDKGFVDKLRHKGIKKYIAFEVPTELAKKKYGNRYDVISGDLLLDEHRTNFGRIFHWEPAAVVFPSCTEDVAETIRFARAEGIGVSTRGAAHSQSQVAINEGGILIDMKAMGRIGSVRWRQRRARR